MTCVSEKKSVGCFTLQKIFDWIQNNEQSDLEIALTSALGNILFKMSESGDVLNLNHP